MTSSSAIGGTLGSSRERKEARKPINVDWIPGYQTPIKIARRFFKAGYYNKENVDLYNRQFIDILEEIRGEVENLGENVKQTLPDGIKLLERLQDVGERAFAVLLEKEVTDYISSLEEREKDRGLSLDFNFPPEMSCLWELLCWGNSDKDNNVKPEMFWGFRYPLGRVYDDTEMGDRVKLQKGAFASLHSELSHSEEELEQLKLKLNMIRDLLRPEVGFQRLEEAIPCDSLNAKKLMGFFSGKDFGYGVVHLACHCVHPNPHATGDTQAYLLFTAHQQDVQMTIDGFLVAKRKDNGFHSRPLVFLNACASATPKSLQSLKLPNVLIDFGAGGVIATACIVPDTFASVFASEFYSRLLDKYIAEAQAAKQIGTPEALLNVLERPTYIGEALLETRLHFWNAYQNPLGLAYGLYAQSDQQFWIKS